MLALKRVTQNLQNEEKPFDSQTSTGKKEAKQATQLQTMLIFMRKGEDSEERAKGPESQAKSSGNLFPGLET